ncbi:alpha/beta fold hydrolase [Sphingobium sp.]|uniref:alpha/beta fold hydrolase n=1 Tax=Sphingobium sp. TaxID=1912891 RepID=UPI002CB8A327|nr:alpha/beta fold hydrolase [Sphingobium sp.]HUD95507.1 alpha/beta fold hydrolase [Sphingobium sp.]
MTIRRHYADGRWGQIHLRIDRSGSVTAPPLLMLHPTPKSGWIWEPLIPALAVGRAVIAPDTPGYGASDPPPTPASITELADEMLDLMTNLARKGVIPLGPFDVVGYHTGSVIAVAMANTAPDRVRRIVPVSLPLYDIAERTARMTRIKAGPSLSDDGSHLSAMWDHMQTLFDPRIDTGWKQESLAENLRSGARAYWGYAAVYGYDLATALPRLTQPVLLIAPEDDLWEPTQRAAPLIPNVTLTPMPGAGHGLFVLERDTIAAMIDAFLAT